MDGFRRNRYPSTDRFLDLFSPSRPDSSSTTSSPAAGVELHESEVLWTSASDGLDTGLRAPADASSTRVPFRSPSEGVAAVRHRQDRVFGILAALPEDGVPAPTPSLLQRKPSIISSSCISSSPPPSSFSTTAAARMIPAIRKPKLDYSISLPSGRMHQAKSLPVDVPVGPRRTSTFKGEAVDGPDAGDRKEIVPPHEIVARTYGTESPMTTFSVLEGAGRTLKGRDLRRVRDAVFRQTGFLD
ncbi:hypothetical protein Cni_G24441 [Canna indica]|uniref:Senescence regulator n=1 Tax=Canna indica TaxID=4628 RepID=A0AAQ3QPK4_9LILI|nr:hypothetical protein Cni_G24441 [Canna indica]